MEKTLEEHQRQLPLLTEMLEKARREEAETKAARDIKQQKYTKTEEKVKRSCEVFEKIKTPGKGKQHIIRVYADRQNRPEQICRRNWMN